jgi:hypothetical protein
VVLGNTMHGAQVFHVHLVLEDMLSRGGLGILAASIQVVPDHGHLISRGLDERNRHRASGRQEACGGGQKEGSEHGGGSIPQTGECVIARGEATRIRGPESSRCQRLLLLCESSKWRRILRLIQTILQLRVPMSVRIT